MTKYQAGEIYYYLFYLNLSTLFAFQVLKKLYNFKKFKNSLVYRLPSARHDAISIGTRTRNVCVLH